MPRKATGRGGWRPGSGRPVGPDPKVLHRPQQPLATRFPCHVLLRVKEDVPSLRSAALAREIESSFRIAADRGEFRLVRYAIQVDRMHLFVEARDGDALGCGMKSIGARFSRAVNRVFERRGPVLWDRFRPEILKNPEQVRRVLRTIAADPRTHTTVEIVSPRTELLRVALGRLGGAS